MSKILYECRSDTHAQWSLDKKDLIYVTSKLKFKSYKEMVDHMSSVVAAISYLKSRDDA
jgi:hypothetical protein